MSETPSGRERRRVAQAGARALMARPGWNPAAVGGAEERLAAAIDQDRAEGAYARAAGCPECAAAQRELGDATALCDAHFGAAV